MRRDLGILTVTFAAAALAAGSALAQSRPAASRAVATAPVATRAVSGVPAAVQASAGRSIGRALQYLESVQTPEGAWQAMGHPDPAITAIVAQAFAQDPHYGPRHPVVLRALEFVMATRRNDGGLYPEGSPLANYYTSVSLMFLSTQPRGNQAIDQAVRGAQAWLKNMQWTEDRNGPDDKPVTPDNPWYGGAGYGNSKRPDLSNTQMMLEALQQSGLPADDPAYQKAVKFISRCQMLSSTNDQPFAREASDGGFIYSPVGDGESKAGTTEEAERKMLRSYGSMTYSGFKSLLYAKVDRSDERVQAAFDWIRSHYTLDENPNMPGARSKEGLFYYYHVFAKALNAWGEDVIVDAEGGRHPWRQDLVAKLTGMQRADGSWMNEADRWYEANPHYVTGLAVLAMQEALATPAAGRVGR